MSVDVRRLIEQSGPGVVIVDDELRLKHCERLFGYADRRRGVAVVSTYHLQGERLAERVRKVTAHELGHLDGRAHCPTPGCVMHAASSVEQLDERGLELCERCRSLRLGWRTVAVAVALMLLLFVGLDAAVRAVSGRTLPFSARQSEVLYKRQTLLPAADPLEAQRAAEMLNALFVQLAPPALSVEPRGSGAEVRASGQRVALFNGVDAERHARAWVERVQPLLVGKGSAAEGCPSCHVLRPREVEESARRRARLWR
jgi:hypothetical protein